MDKQALFSAREINQQQLLPVKDVVICTDMVFTERFTSSGIILPSDNGRSSGVRPRWGRVYAIGPEQQDVKVGQWICVAHGRWTRGVDILDNGTELTIRKIDPKDILLISDELPQDDTMSTAVLA
jgi:co-chaperonin GroES (HSP10)